VGMEEESEVGAEGRRGRGDPRRRESCVLDLYLSWLSTRVSKGASKFAICVCLLYLNRLQRVCERIHHMKSLNFETGRGEEVAQWCALMARETGSTGQQV
jgi:hypothetical protein